jgi:hypothetical protein
MFIMLAAWAKIMVSRGWSDFICQRANLFAEEQ